MTRRRKILVLAACGMAALVTLGFFYFHESEPSYDGRTLSEWLEMYCSTWPFDQKGNFRLSDGPTNAAGAVGVLKIGTNAIPTLLRWADATNSLNPEIVYNLLMKLPPRVSLAIFRPFWNNDARRKYGLFELGIDILGTNAAPAVPLFKQRFEAAKTWKEMKAAGYCLRRAGPQGLAVLSAAICDNPTNMQSRTALRQLGECRRLDTDAESAVTPLLRAINGKSVANSIIAMDTLGHLALDADRALPVLTNKLSSKNTDVRFAALRALAGYETNAISVEPVVRAALKDPVKLNRTAATWALEAMLPKKFTNSQTSGK